MRFSDVVTRISEFRNQCYERGSVAWFRGHKKADWQLLTSLHRHLRLDFPDYDHLPKTLVRDVYKSLFFRFKGDAWPLLQDGERTDWGVVFTMQHHGLPTKLLDWTESFACALFFALLDRNPDDHAAIWCLDAQALNAEGGLIFLDENDTPQRASMCRTWRWLPPHASAEELPTVAVVPIFTNSRMSAQRAAFTVAGDSLLPLEEERADLVESGRLMKLDMPPTVCGEAQEYLETAGLTALTFYPDMHGLALRHKMQAEKRRSRAEIAVARTLCQRLRRADERAPHPDAQNP